MRAGVLAPIVESAQSARSRKGFRRFAPMVGRIFETESCDRKRYHNMKKTLGEARLSYPPQKDTPREKSCADAVFAYLGVDQAPSSRPIWITERSAQPVPA